MQQEDSGKAETGSIGVANFISESKISCWTLTLIIRVRHQISLGGPRIDVM